MTLERAAMARGIAAAFSLLALVFCVTGCGEPASAPGAPTIAPGPQPKLATITGEVTQPRPRGSQEPMGGPGLPLPEATVALTGIATVSTTTDENGHFTAEVPVAFLASAIAVRVSKEGFAPFDGTWWVNSSPSARTVNLVPASTLRLPDVDLLTITVDERCGAIPASARTFRFPTAFRYENEGRFNVEVTGAFAFGETTLRLNSAASANSLSMQFGMPEGFNDVTDHPVIVQLTETSSASLEGQITAEGNVEDPVIQGAYNGTIGYCPAFDGASPYACAASVAQCSSRAHPVSLRRR